MINSTKSFDVFLSHNNLDMSMVERIAKGLKNLGLEPWLDKWCLTPGGKWPEELAAGLLNSRACAVFVGSHGLGDWEREELDVALTRAAKDRFFRLFLVLLPGLTEPFNASILPPFLSTRTWVDLRKGINHPHALQPLINAIKGVAFSSDTPITPRTDICPYRGLLTFDEMHTEFFFGREGDIQRLLEKLKMTRFLAVIGPSGSGKSSILRAGLIPALRQGRLSGSESWTIRVFTPGAQPLATLAAQLLRLYPHASMKKTIEDIATDVRTLHFAVMQALANSPGTARVIWVIDQFEEAFTLCHNEHERLPFFKSLLYAAAVPEGCNLVVLGMRADFYSKCAVYPELAGALATQQYLVSPMDLEGDRQAITEPARCVELEFEQGLVETILDEVVDQSGTLPLLEHALLELWTRRRGQMMTLEGYRETGGVKGSLAQRAEAIYASFNLTRQTITRQVLLRLTQPGEGTEDTKRRATINELITRANESETIEEVVRALTDARLLTTGAEEESGEGWVEVSHEALIRGWPRLRQWIDEGRMALRYHRRLTEAASEWLRLHRDDGVLYRGVPLVQAQEWRESHEASLNELEREFLDASVAQKSREEEEEKGRRLRELEVAQSLAQSEGKRAKVARYFTLGLLVLLIAVMFVAYFAQQQKKISRSRELAVVTLSQLDIDPERSILIALEAIKNWHTYESEDAVRQSLLVSQVRATLHDSEPSVDHAVFSPDGKYVLSVHNDNTARLWEFKTGKEVTVLRGHTGQLTSAQFSPNGERIVSASWDSTARIWEAKTGQELAVLVGHTGRVASAQFSPDGKLILTNVSGDATVRIWEANTRKEVTVLYGHTNEVNSMQFSSDGKLIVTASLDSTARVWKTNTGKQLVILRGHTQNVISAQFSPDDKKVVTASLDSTARVWETCTGNELVLLSGHLGPIASVKFSADGKQIVSAGWDATARIWEAGTGKELTVLRGHTSIVNSAQFSPNGRLIVTASNDITARIWDVNTGKELAVLRGHRSIVNSAQFSPNGRLIVTTSNDSTVRLWEANKGAELATMCGNWGCLGGIPFSPNGKQFVFTEWHVSEVGSGSMVVSGDELSEVAVHMGFLSGAQFSPDGKLILTNVSGDTTVRVWKANTGEELMVLGNGRRPISTTQFSLNSKKGMIDFNGVEWTWQTMAGKELAILRSNIKPITSAQFSFDGKKVVTGSFDSTAQVWEVNTGRELVVLHGHTDIVANAQFSQDGKYIVSASWDSTARIWEAKTGQELAVLVGHTGRVTIAQFSPDGKRIVTAGKDENAILWETSTGKELVVLRGHTNWIVSAKFSFDGTKVITAGADDTARLWEISTGRELAVLTGHRFAVYDAQFSPDGKKVVTVGRDASARIWEASTGRELMVLAGHTHAVLSAQFSPDSKRVLTASWDGTTRIWDASTGETLAVLHGHTHFVNSAQFSPDGKLIVTASEDGTSRLYLLHIEDLIALAKTRVTRELTCQERQIYLHENVFCEAGK